MTIAKICGLSTPDAVDAALTGGAAYVGFIFFAASPRNIAIQAAAHLATPARRTAKVVAVTVNPDNEFLGRLMSGLAPDAIQLHGKEPPARAREIGALTGAAVIKVVAISNAADVAAARDYESVVDHLMFETRPAPDATLPGGLGVAFDWSLLAGRRFAQPWFLAGGLDPWNVMEAVNVSGAPMVDVSSGVERGPGLKDPALITSFLNAVRRG